MKKINLQVKAIAFSLMALFIGQTVVAQTQSFPANRAYAFGLSPANKSSQDAVSSYNIWKTNFLATCSNGRYRVKFDNPSQTVSEGIAYGMLLTAYAGDRTIFDGLWNYYKDNRNSNGVMNWKIEGCSGVSGQNGATDAEIDAAMALIVADYQWGSTGTINYSNDAKTLLNIMKSKEVEANTFVLKPGDMFGGSQLTNPSYFAPGYFRKFASFMNDSFWNSVADKCYEIINNNLSVNNAAGGIVSDWCTASGSYSNQAGGYANGGTKYSYDAARTPWRIATDYVWYGNASAKTYSKKSSDFVRVTLGGSQNIKDGYNQNGTPSGQYHNPTFVGAFAAAAMGGDNQVHLNNSYADLKSLNEPNSYFNHTLKTLYLFLLNGDFYLPGGTSTPVNTPPSVSITSPGNNATFTQGANITVTASASDSDGTVSKVEFFRGATKVGEDTSNPYQYTFTNASSGNYSVTAKATDNDGATRTSSARTFTVSTANPTNNAPSVNITSPSNNATFTQGASITIRANAADSDGTVTKVEFYNGSTKLGQDTTSPYQYVIANAGAGTYNLTAKATDNNGATKTTAVTRVVVNSVNNPTSCSFGTPTTATLPSLNFNYNKMYVLGNGGPNTSNFREFQINWDARYNGLYVFAYSTNNGVPNWYIDLKSKITQNFNSTRPSVTVTNSGIAGFDGAYWVTKDVNNFVMVSKTGGFTLYFSTSSTAPTCTNARIAATATAPSELLLYPNPAKESITLSRAVDQEGKTYITDMQGIVLLENKLTSKDTKINISTLRAGIYILVVETKSGIEKTRFSVKE